MIQDFDFKPSKVLVIAYYFPPMGLSGVQRTLKFVKYLPQFGWHPTVLTVEPWGYFAKDETLLADLEGKPVEIVQDPGGRTRPPLQEEGRGRAPPGADPQDPEPGQRYGLLPRQ